MSNVDPLATTVFNNLQTAFPCEVNSDLTYKTINTIGIEVEVKWRDYFPALHSRFLLDKTYSQLSEAEQDELTTLCNVEEASLLPKLKQTVTCGLSNGADKYWEFAFNPVNDISITDRQVSLLQAHKLIPAGQHSLHITIANMRVNIDSYMLAMMLEMISCSPDRIKQGFNKINPKMSAAWGRKGYAGVYQKDFNDLVNSAQIATEFRMPVLDTDRSFPQLIEVAAKYGDIAIDAQNGRGTKEWSSLKKDLVKVLTSRGFPDNNWSKPNLNPGVWLKFATEFEHIQHHALKVMKHYGVVQ